jgi:hypothetical protein
MGFAERSGYIVCGGFPAKETRDEQALGLGVNPAEGDERSRCTATHHPDYEALIGLAVLAVVTGRLGAAWLGVRLAATFDGW